VTVSRTASSAWPRISNPMMTLPMLAGALAVEEVAIDCEIMGMGNV
jgi:hypothetical protein